MLLGGVILLTSFAYLGILFAIAYWGDKRADAGRSIIANPYIYALSMAVYATSWTFYGSVGRAAASGVGFLPIYLGPTLMAALWWVVLRKMIRISKANRITSIADFIAARYGKSTVLGGLVTVIAVVGVIPYIALQLKAVSTSFLILLQYPEVVMPPKGQAVDLFKDTALYVALLLAAFTLLFGTRHLDATERHEGMVAAIAFESVVKLLSFLAVGAFVTFWLYDGFADVFAQARTLPDIEELLTLGGVAGTYGSWASLIFLSMLSILFLPRQFQISVVENVNENHLAKAIWLFPAYLFAINVFVLPITFAGLMQFGDGQIDADTFVLTLPMVHGREALALFVFIGGLSAATGMVIVETIALSTMICNDLVMPVLLRWKRLALAQRADLSGLLLGIRRGAIVLLMMLGYAYYRLAGEAYALVSIGLVSFAAVAQFAPAMLGGMYWKQGTQAGALTGLTLGFALWVYTLLLPSFAKSGWLPISFVEDGPWGIAWLKPLALFGLEGLDDISHSLFWSLLANVGGYVTVSLLGHQSIREHAQALLFVDVFKVAGGSSGLWRGSASVQDIVTLVGRFIGPARAAEAFNGYAMRQGLGSVAALTPDAAFVHFAERLLAGAIGAASARVMIASVAKEEPLSMEEVLGILDEASQLIAYSRKLEQKSRELEAATAELREANERLQELDRLKDDFISTVTHELRTPLTSIRAFSEILQGQPDIDPERRQQFITIIVKESERLTRLINQVLDLAKLESGKAEWHTSELDVRQVIEDAVSATSALMREHGVTLSLRLPEQVPPVMADRDRLMQVMVNLIANGVKFCDRSDGRIEIALHVLSDRLRVDVHDNGPGIDPAHHESIFEKFHQVGDTLTGKPQGTGLGLPISRQIIQHLGGTLWVDSVPGQGATFSFTLPLDAHRARPPSTAPQETGIS
ncbi:sensor histidine kinase [Caldimonas thermodepolymerans]|uniref:histidine kinase n=1 Tax=Caldimonas thermodepolymerans TaxID=215580 RepID=A0AA46DH41_9BURK|nr:sensor histidine kinase [Caldimonas thermodepolymerans]TCP09466.1 Na+/proline symporter [Caldimonas thermodepolymerans]UZG49490.1 sensor histidine kinase [Caldimonas thermodepolymerans]